jgi:DNA-binding MarR family transcriptional regulator
MDTSPLPLRILDGLDRIGAVLRADGWARGEALGLTPTQAGILSYLARRGGARLQEVAAHLAVSLPTVSGAVDALERKGLVARARDAADARALALKLTGKGRALASELAGRASTLGDVVAALPASEQADLYLHLVKLIRALQLAGAIPQQRLCLTCRYFRPHAHPDADAPHHCAFVNAAFGSRDLRLDCAEHEAAAPADQTAIWSAFETGGRSSRQAKERRRE